MEQKDTDLKKELSDLMNLTFLDYFKWSKFVHAAAHVYTTFNITFFQASVWLIDYVFLQSNFSSHPSCSLSH